MRINIAKRIYEYRKAAGLSQEDVANRIGVSRQAVSKWECAEASPDTENLIALAVLYGVTVDELLFVDPEGHSALASEVEAEASGEGAGCEVASDGAASDDLGATAQGVEGECTCSGDAARKASDVADGRGEDYVDISLDKGIHVRDSKKGEEVHVDWSGIHIDSDQEHVHVNFAQLAKMIREFRKDQL